MTTEADLRSFAACEGFSVDEALPMAVGHLHSDAVRRMATRLDKVLGPTLTPAQVLIIAAVAVELIEAGPRELLDILTSDPPEPEAPHA